LKRPKRSKPVQRRKVAPISDRGSFKNLMKVATGEMRARRPRRNATSSRMVEFAQRVERCLLAQGAMPTRRQDRSLIGDLADLEWRTALLWQAVENLARSNRNTSSDEFDARLMILHSSVDALGDIIRDLKGPLTRLLRARCGVEGLALSALGGASSLVQGLRKRKTDAWD
jgi:hypothetical protein